MGKPFGIQGNSNPTEKNSTRVSEDKVEGHDGLLDEDNLPVPGAQHAPVPEHGLLLQNKII